ncbi:MAG: M23 family metallopeptidase [Rhodospirillaceae bacterium]
MRSLFFALVVCLAVIPAYAQTNTFKLEGKIAQGGLVIGHTQPDAKVFLDNKEVPVSKTGTFLLGFPWNAGPAAQLVVRIGRKEDIQILAIQQRQFKVQRIDGLPKRKVTPNPADLKRIAREGKEIDAAKRLRAEEPFFLSGFEQPAEGRVSGVYGSRRILNGQPRRPHFGLDIAAPTGTQIRALADGIVRFVHPGMFFNGKTVLIDHGMGLTSIYIHMNATRVKAEQKVRKGDAIGAVGRTGRTTGPHLHLGVSLNGTPLDPGLLVGR